MVEAHYYSYFPQPQSKMMWIQKNEHTQCVAAVAADVEGCDDRSAEVDDTLPAGIAGEDVV